jgi:hypothetical protein
MQTPEERRLHDKLRYLLRKALGTTSQHRNPERDRIRNTARNRKWRLENPDKCHIRNCPEPLLYGQICEKHRGIRRFRKIDVLTHYGKGKRLQCCWEGCTIIDPDMLSIDHVNNDGAADRRKGRAGTNLYTYLISHEYPIGYQTLCFNHQMKKEITRQREEANATNTATGPSKSGN